MTKNKSHQPNIHKPHAKFRGNITVKAKLLEAPDTRLYAEALILLARQLEEEERAKVGRV